MTTPAKTHRTPVAGDVPEITQNLRLMLARIHGGFTQGELATQIGVNRRTVQRAEDGHEMRRTTLIAWAFETGVDLHWIETGHAPGSGTCPLCPQQGSNLRPADYDAQNLGGKTPILKIHHGGADGTAHSLPPILTVIRSTDTCGLAVRPEQAGSELPSCNSQTSVNSTQSIHNSDRPAGPFRPILRFCEALTRQLKSGA